MNERATFTAREAAEYLGVSLPTMYQMCRRSDFPAINIGKKILIPRKNLDQWITDNTGIQRQ